MSRRSLSAEAEERRRKEPQEAAEGGRLSEAARGGALVVKGILFSDDNPAAVVGAEIAHIGDTIAGAEIVAIRKDEVEFEKDGKKWTQAVEP